MPFSYASLTIRCGNQLRISPTFMLKLVLVPVKDNTLTLTLWPLLTTSATLATRPSRRSSEMCTRPSHRFLRESDISGTFLIPFPQPLSTLVGNEQREMGLKLKSKVPRNWPNNKLELPPSQRKSWGLGWRWGQQILICVN